MKNLNKIIMSESPQDELKRTQQETIRNSDIKWIIGFVLMAILFCGYIGYKTDKYNQKVHSIQKTSDSTLQVIKYNYKIIE